MLGTLAMALLVSCASFTRPAMIKSGDGAMYALRHRQILGIVLSPLVVSCTGAGRNISCRKVPVK